MGKSISVVREIDPRVFIAAAEQITGLERTTIHRKAKKGEFPAPHYVGRRRCWLMSELEAWSQGQLQNRTAPAAPEAK
jgi:predicted DNA-binding transcriptional regulator AlpA